MRPGDTFEEELRGYILGQLTEADEERFEKSLLGDDRLFATAEELAEVVVDELVEDYVSRKLTFEERLSFEQRLQRCPDTLNRLPLGRALVRLSEQPERPKSWFERLRLWVQPLANPAPAMASALAFVLLSGGSWSAYRIAGLQNQLDQSDAELSQLAVAREGLQLELDEALGRGNQLEQQLDEASVRLVGLERTTRTTPSMGVSAIASFLLTPGLQRSGGGTNRIELPADRQLVELMLDVGIDDYESYEAALFDSGGGEILTLKRLPALTEGDEVRVVLPLPIQLLRSDDYQIRLRGELTGGQSEMIDRYYFRAVHP